MAHSIELSRSTVISLATLTAACGLYALYSSYSARPTTALRRSNAVHRPRRDRQAPVIESRNSTPDACLGTLIIRQGDEALHVNLANLCRLSSPDELRQFVETRQYILQQSQGIQKAFADTTMDCILSACHIAIHNADTWSQVESLGFGNLLRAMASRDEEQIRLHSYEVRDHLSVVCEFLVHVSPEQMFDILKEGVTDDQIDRAVDKFLESDKWTGASSDSDAADFAETEGMDMLDAANKEPSQGLRGLLYYIAEEDAKRKAYEHRGICCEECGEQPIRGIRYHCLNCPDYDLCAMCEAHTMHQKTHVFAKIKIPVPVLSQPAQEYKLWYPGDPRKIHGPLDPSLKKRLCQGHGYEEPQMDALYDQFTCLANVPWESDASGVKAAIDRRAFDKALTSTKWPQRFSANAMYDRMFGFYDTDGNGIIDFPEFVGGMAYLRGPHRFSSLHRAIRGYDLDGDGYVSRGDFLRLLRAKFEIQKQLVSDMVNGQAPETTHAAVDILRSSQPISSIFTLEDIPPGEIRWPRGKEEDAFGDLQPLAGTETVLNDDDDWTRGSNGRLKRQPAHERLRNHLSRFEELLYSPSDPDSRLNAMDQLDGLVETPDEANNDSPNHFTSFIDIGAFERNEASEDFYADEPYVRNLLWQLTEAGLNELLDTIFMSRERQDSEASMTRTEREKWRKEIDEEVESQRKAGESRLAAIEQQSFEPKDDAMLSLNDGIVPTDWESLERREREIPEAPLEQLLDASGYGVREAGDDAESSPTARTQPLSASIDERIPSTSFSIRATPCSPLSTVVSQDDIVETPDPTLPHNRPNAEPAAEPSVFKQAPNHDSNQSNLHHQSFVEIPEAPPHKQRLEFLASMDEVQREIDERGGPGRLSYDEVEAITIAETRGEIRGLIKSWLEFAAF